MKEDRADIHDELVQEFYGINPGTFKVDSVAVTRSGNFRNGLIVDISFTNYKGATFWQRSSP